MDRILDSLMRQVSPDTDADHRIVIRYGLELFILKVVSYAAVVVLSIIFGVLAETLLFCLAFVPLREAAGGVHARSRMVCFIESICLVTVVMTVIKTIHFLNGELILGVVALFFAGVLFIFAPADTPDKRLSAEERRAMRTKTRIIALTELLLAVGLYISHAYFAFPILRLIYLCIVLSVISSALLVCLELIKQHTEKSEIE
jgi:accessory gene regulator B